MGNVIRSNISDKCKSTILDVLKFHMLFVVIGNVLQTLTIHLLLFQKFFLPEE
jgi:hypothetical protein